MEKKLAMNQIIRQILARLKLNVPVDKVKIKTLPNVDNVYKFFIPNEFLLY